MQHAPIARAICAFSLAELLFLNVASIAWAQVPSVCKPNEEFPQLQEIAQKFAIEVATNDLKFPVKTVHGLIEGIEASDESLKKYQNLFTAEFSRYPNELVRNTKLKRIVLCEELKFDGQRRNAIPDFEHDVLYLDVKRGDHNQQYLQKVIHHEFFHLIDYRDDGNVYKDEKWSALNSATFRYGDGGRNAQDNSSTSVLTDRYPGFLNHYSTTGVEEDKAEIFANLLVVPMHVDKRASVDAIVQSKVDAMKSLIQTFCPEVKEDFWKPVAK